MLKKLEDWIKKTGNTELEKKISEYQELETAYGELANRLGAMKQEILLTLMSLPEFENALAKALTDFKDKVIDPKPAKQFKIKTAANFKKARKEKFLTQEQAAQRLKIPLHVIRNWEQKGIGKEDLEKANRILEVK